MLTREIAPLSPQTDPTSLFEAARKQNEHAVVQLIEKCSARIVAGIEIAGVSRYDSSFEDAQNQALFEIWKQFPKANRSEAVCFWMHGIARRVAASRVIDPAVRQRRRDEKYRTHRGSDEGIADGPGQSIADRDLLGRVLQELSPDHREVLVLRFLEGFSEQETATLLATTPKTISSRTSRAKRAAIDIATRLEGK